MLGGVQLIVFDRGEGIPIELEAWMLRGIGLLIYKRGFRNVILCANHPCYSTVRKSSEGR